MRPISLRLSIVAALGVALTFCMTLPLISFPVFATQSNSSQKEPADERALNLSALLQPGKTVSSDEMPADAKAIVERYDDAATEIRFKAALEIREKRLDAIRRLKAMQDEHTRAARLDEAVAIRDTIRRMLESSFRSIDNPGAMHAYADQIGKSFLVRVTGRTTGSIYGTEFFTYDSDIATACVHSGALRDGETGAVIVTMIRTGEPHVGSIKHGVRSYDYGVYSASYTVRRWKPTAEEIELGSLQLE